MSHYLGVPVFHGWACRLFSLLYYNQWATCTQIILHRWGARTSVEKWSYCMWEKYVLVVSRDIASLPSLERSVTAWITESHTLPWDFMRSSASSYILMRHSIPAGPNSDIHGPRDSRTGQGRAKGEGWLVLRWSGDRAGCSPSPSLCSPPVRRGGALWMPREASI